MVYLPQNVFGGSQASLDCIPLGPLCFVFPGEQRAGVFLLKGVRFRALANSLRLLFLSCRFLKEGPIVDFLPFAELKPVPAMAGISFFFFPSFPFFSQGHSFTGGLGLSSGPGGSFPWCELPASLEKAFVPPEFTTRALRPMVC